LEDIDITALSDCRTSSRAARLCRRSQDKIDDEDDCDTIDDDGNDDSEATAACCLLIAMEAVIYLQEFMD
jgi:hypothetical protein